MRRAGLWGSVDLGPVRVGTRIRGGPTQRELEDGGEGVNELQASALGQWSRPLWGHQVPLVLLPVRIALGSLCLAFRTLSTLAFVIFYCAFIVPFLGYIAFQLALVLLMLVVVGGLLWALVQPLLT